MPTDVKPTWATDASYPAGTDPWSGTPTRVAPDPGDAAAGFEPGDKPSAQNLNSLLGILCDFAAVVDGEGAMVLGPTVGLGQAGWVVDFAAGPPPPTAYILATGNSEYRMLDLGPYLRSGLNLVSVDVLVTPGAARAGGNRMALSVFWHQSGDAWPANGAPAQVGSTISDDGTTNPQVLACPFTLGPLERDDIIVVALLKAGNTAGAANDRLHGWKLTFADP